MAIIIEKRINLDAPIKLDSLCGFTFTTESEAHRFVVRCDQNGQELTLTGTTSAKFVRADGNTVELVGTIEDGKAVVTLAQDCYNVYGRFQLAIFNTVGNTKLCIYACIGTVQRAQSGNLIDGGGIIPDVEDLIADIQAAVESIPPSYTTLLASVAGTYSASKTYSVGDYAWYNGTLYRCSTAISTAEAWTSGHWTAAVLGDDVSSLKSALDAIETLSIDGYTRTHIDVEGTLTNNAFWDNTNKPVQISGYSYLTVACTPGNTYLISGTGSTAARLYTVLDSNNEIIDIAPSAQTARFEDVQYTAPDGAATIIVNAQNAQGSPSVKKITWHFEKTDGSNPIGVEKSTNVWEIGTGDFKTLVDLHGSANGTFNYTRILYKNNIFKTAGDDIAPLSLLSAGYVGANHGFIFVYDITATGHGLSTSDIGRTCVIDSDTWVLLKILDANTFEVGCRNPNVWFGIKRVATVPSSFDFGKTIAAESSQLAQLLPSAKNVNVTVNKNTGESFEVLESYDIIDPSIGIAWIIANVGSATNDSIVEHSDSALTLRNLYQFDKYGACVVTQSVKANKAVGLEFYSGSQSQAFGVTDYYCVPKTNFASLREITETQYFDRTTWDQSTEPPKVFLQVNGNLSGMNSMMLSGVELSNRNDAIATTAGFVYGTSRKMYPYAVQPNKALSVGDVYSFITYRVPMHVYDKNKTIQFAGWCKVGKKYYVFAYVIIAVKASLELPKEMQGLQAKTIYGEYMTLKNEYVINALDLESTRQGSILIELS